MTLPHKSDGTEWDYSVTLTGAGWDTTDSITSATVVSSMPSLTVSRVSTNGATVTFWLAGGVAGQVAVLTITVVTALGRTIEVQETVGVS